MSAPDQTTARRFETTLQGVLVAALSMQQVYRDSESTERLLPCVVLKARATGIDMSIRAAGKYATSLDFRASAMVAATVPDSARAVEDFALRLKDAIEAAVITSGWQYLRLDYQGDERALEGARREFTHIYTVTALAV